jgi:hypothetical protein
VDPRQKIHPTPNATNEPATQVLFSPDGKPLPYLSKSGVEMVLPLLECKATWKREFKLPWRKAGLLISMIEWTRTSRLSIKISFSPLLETLTHP